MKRSLALALCALVAGCEAAPPPSVEGLRFPVLVLFERGAVRHDDADDLRSMSTQRVVNSDSPPFLVDAGLDVWRLDGLASVHGGTWLMANPTGRTDVTFELVRVASDDAAHARRLIAARDPALGHDAEGVAARERLAAARTLAEMLDAIGR